MNTREWLEAALVQIRLDADWEEKSSPGERSKFRDEEALMAGLIAHLNAVGWPEEPKNCNTCQMQRHKDRRGTFCWPLNMPCASVGNGCLAWEKKEAGA